MYTVTLTLPDLEAATPEEAAKMFLDVLVSGDWSGGLFFEVHDGDTKQGIELPGDDVFATLAVACKAGGF